MSSHQTEIRPRLPEQDPAFVYRIVGCDEYYKFLTDFEKLFRTLTPNQIDQIDQYIKSRDEFAVFTNLSRRFEKKPSLLSERPQSTDDKFERRGLVWISALARMELGAMLAGFTSHVDPLIAMRPNEAGMPAFREMLLDGLRTHYLHLQQDPNFKQKYTGLNNIKRRLAYIRRLHMMLEYAKTFEAVEGTKFLTAEANHEFQTWKRTVENILNSLMFDLQASLSRTRTRSDTNDRLRTCPWAASKMRQELANGTATVRPINPFTGRPQAPVVRPAAPRSQ